MSLNLTPSLMPGVKMYTYYYHAIIKKLSSKKYLFYSTHKISVKPRPSSFFSAIFWHILWNTLGWRLNSLEASPDIAHCLILSQTLKISNHLFEGREV